MQDTTQRLANARDRNIQPIDADAIPLTINGKPYFHGGDPDMPLLWFLRDVLRLTGTKAGGCGDGADCGGVCTLLVEGRAMRACRTPMKQLIGKRVVTIEGLQEGALHPVQQAWIEEDVSPTGYVQPAVIMAAVGLLMRNHRPSDEEIARLAVLCRDGSYPRVRKAVMRAAELMRAAGA